MYNRYVPQDTSYTWIGPEQEEKPKPPPERRGSTKQEKEGPVQYINRIWSAIRSSCKSGKVDTGDLLLLLILLLLLKEGEDIELILALGLVLLLGIGEEAEKKTEGTTASPPAGL